MTMPSAFALFAAVLLGLTPAPTVQRFHFAHDAILGTSLDLTFSAISSRDAATAEARALAEIERLRGILSGYDATSELSRLMATGRLAVPSADLVAVLRRYDAMQQLSGGAYTARIAPLSALWRDAEAANRLPDAGALRTTVARVAAPAWTMEADGAIRMLTTDRIDVNSLGKGYIIDRAVAAARAAVPTLRGGIINLGGDIRAWGETATPAAGWRIGVMDPRVAADNAPPIALLQVQNRAVSSSGGYARGFTIAGVHYSHIIDPRTGMPADRVAATTVVTQDNATANALATTLSVLTPAEGLALAGMLPGVEALIVGSDGVMHRTPGFGAYELPGPPTQGVGVVTAKVTIDITPTTPNRHRPYVAVWVTDAAGKPVRTLAFWGTKRKYIPDMSKWYGVMSAAAPQVIDAVTRATRPVGIYTLAWDGLDDHGQAVAPGTYTFWFEESFENGPHSLRSAPVACGPTPGTATFDATPAFAGGTVTCSAGT